MKTLRKIHHITLILLWFAFPALLSAQSNTWQQVDSLRQALELTEGRDKLRTYERLYAIYFMQARDDLKRDTLFAIFDEMDAEAKRQESVGHRASIRMNKMGVMQNRGEYSEVIRVAPEYLEFVADLEEWKQYFQIYDLLVGAHLRLSQNEQAAAEVQKMYREAEKLNHKEGMGVALYTMANVYLIQSRQEDSEDCLRRCIELLNDDDSMCHLLSNVWSALATSFINQLRSDEALEAAKEMEKVNHRYEAFAKGASIASAWGNLWSLYTRIYINMFVYDLAEVYCDKLDSLSNSRPHKITIYLSRANIHTARGEYDQGLEMIDNALAIIPETDIKNLNQARGIKMLILSNLNDEAEQIYDLCNIAIADLKSQQSLEYARQVDEVRTEYEVHRHIAEKERQRIIIGWAVTGCLILGALVLVFIVYSRRLYQKNLALYEKINEQSRLDKELEEAKAKIPEEQQSREQKLFLELQRLMQSEKLFTQPDIDRDKVAVLLGTNREYLTNAIRQETGLSFSLYVADLRVQYALDLMTNHLDFPLDDIILQSGIGSYSSFYRIFTQKYGMNPTEYRKISVSKIVQK